jgi:hypothetical protein
MYYIYTYIHTCTYIYTYIYMAPKNIYRSYTYICMYIHIYVHIYTHTRTNRYMYIYKSLIPLASTTRTQPAQVPKHMVCPHKKNTGCLNKKMTKFKHFFLFCRPFFIFIFFVRTPMCLSQIYRADIKRLCGSLR